MSDLERAVDDQLEMYSLEEFFEFFDITPFEIIQLAFENGLLDEEILENMVPIE